MKLFLITGKLMTKSELTDLDIKEFEVKESPKKFVSKDTGKYFPKELLETPDCDIFRDDLFNMITYRMVCTDEKDIPRCVERVVKAIKENLDEKMHNLILLENNFGNLENQLRHYQIKNTFEKVK